jgi:hypothetical protein
MEVLLMEAINLEYETSVSGVSKWCFQVFPVFPNGVSRCFRCFQVFPVPTDPVFPITGKITIKTVFPKCFPHWCVRRLGANWKEYDISVSGVSKWCFQVFPRELQGTPRNSKGTPRNSDGTPRELRDVMELRDI